MKQESIQQKLRQDPRLKHLDPQCMEVLSQFASELSSAPANEKAAVFFAIMQKARTQNLAFSPPEQELLFSILTEQMSPEEKQKALMIRRLSAQLMQQKNIP